MKKQIVFLCVGTSKISGDSLAPVIGDRLVESDVNAFVYGTTSQNVNQKNLTNYLNFIKKVHPNCLLIVVDSGLSKTIKKGTVIIKKGGITPGKALYPLSKRIGDIGVLGVVNCFDNNIIEALQVVNTGFIFAFGNYIANLIVASLREIGY